MAKYLAILILLALTGCDPARDYPMERKAKVEISSIVWVDAKPTECGHETGVIHACAQWTADHKLCTITLPADSPSWMVGHEVQHCFGFVHGVLK